MQYIMPDRPPSLLPREERFARGVASGLHPFSAWRAAGFARDDDRTWQRLADPLILAHAQQLAAKYAEPIDPYAIIAKLFDIADAALDLGTDAGARAGCEAAIRGMRALRELSRKAPHAWDDEAE